MTTRIAGIDNSVPFGQRHRCPNQSSSATLSLVLAHAYAFTLVEVLMVIAILVIAALAAIPLISSAGSMGAQAAAHKLAADLEYAKSMAVSRGQTYTVVFNTSTETYSLKDQNKIVIGHPIKKGSAYTVDLTKDRRFAGVDMLSVNFDSTAVVRFDYLGSPHAADGTDLEKTGTVTLSCGSSTWTVSVEPVTGVITTSD